MSEPGVLTLMPPIFCTSAIPVSESIGAVFEQQVRLHPDQIAYRSHAELITYDKLNRRSNRVAWALRASFPDSDQRVGIRMRPGAGQVAALFGILKSGKTAIVLDLLGPEDGVREILAESEPRMVLTDRDNADAARPLLPSDCALLVDDDFAEAFPEVDPDWEVPAESPACLIFTSGSTGRPKGVIRLHRNIVWGVNALTGEQALTASDRYCFVAAHHTANGTMNLFRALLRGATVLGFDLREQGIDRLGAWLREQHATVFTTPASIFRHFVQTLAPEQRFPEVRLVRLSSEKVLLRDCEACRRHFPDTCRLFNMISCTEAGNLALYHVKVDASFADDTVPIGYPLPGVELRLLNDVGREVDVDEVGELTVRSPAVAPGYWRQPELTAQAFRRPVGTEGDCWYHTGDLAIRHQDGCLVYVGRRDLRVKIRGLGVDLQAVEAALENHPDIGAAAVTIREDRNGESQLVAFIATKFGKKPDSTELRQHLRQRFPEPMLPAGFVIVESLPHTPSGKLDRVALSSLSHSVARSASDYIEPQNPSEAQASLITQHPPLNSQRLAPQTPAEAAMALIWREVLGCGQVSRQDSFYELGGHSLSATRVVARVREAFQITVSLRKFLENPTIRWLAEQVAADVKRDTSPVVEPLCRRGSNGEALPLSFAQQRLWFLEELNPGSANYNLPWAMRLCGALNVGALERSLGEVVQRHESLRTVFRTSNAQVHPVVLRQFDVTLKLVDLSDCPEPERESECRRYLREESCRHFDLEQSPGWRAKLVRIAEQEHVLLLAMHHIVSDRWSKWVLIEELTTLYSAFVAGRSSPLPELEVQYADFARWERQPGHEPRIRSQLDYWKRRLANLESPELPTDRTRAALVSSVGAVLTTRIPTSLVAALKDLAIREQVSLYVTLLAAFEALLHRVTGQTDIAVGTAIGNRQHVELERLIGCFVNTIVLRGDLARDPRFRDFLRHFWGRVVEDFENQDVPFDRLVEELRPRRAPGRHPLFEILFTLQNMPRLHLALTGLEVEPWEVELGTAKFDLSVLLFDEIDGLRVRWEYRTDLFDSATIECLASAFQSLLQGVCDQPSARLSELPLLTSEQRRELVVEWNDTTVEYPRDRCLHALFDAQAQRTPSAIALCTEGRTITYQSLSEQSNRMAHHLRRLGVQRGDRVALYLDRSASYVIAALAVLKTGAAYIPLPKEYPALRLEFMLSDAGSRIVVTDRPLPPELVALAPSCIDLSEAASVLASYPPTPPLVAVLPLDPACVLYTSGSTGRPRGVGVPHRAIVRLVCGTDFVPWSPELRFLLLAPVAFDASHFELWGPLLHGARIVVFPLSYPDLAELEAVLQRESISCLWLTAGLFHRIIDDRPAMLRAVRHILTGGEALSPVHVQRALELLPDSILVNGYGPTETTTFACTFRIPQGVDWSTRRSIPIGRPIANTRCHVLDPYGQLVPVGVAGELYVGGDGVVLGYLNDPESTEQKFLPDPFSHEPGGRWFRTGDRCRWLPDGTLEFLGRFDRQLKVRGFRVEPVEIEAVLALHPAVERAAVVARHDSGGGVELAAVIVPRGTQKPEASSLRAHLEARLPGPMIPARFELRASLPLNANGKVDRRSLEQEPFARPAGSPAAVAPQSESERRLLSLMSELLGREGLGVRDDFFECGGHSLLALKFVAELERQFGIPLKLADLFQFPTVAALATRVDDHDHCASWAAARRFRGATQGAPLFHIPGRFGFEFLAPRLAELIGSLRPYFDGLQFPGLDGRTEIPTDGRAIAADLVRQIQAIWPIGPLCLSGHSWGGVVAYEVACQLAGAGRAVESVILFDSIVPQSSRKRPLVRALQVLAKRLRGLEPGARHRFLWELVRNKAQGLIQNSTRRLGRGTRSPRISPRNRGLKVESDLLWRATEEACTNSRPGPYAGHVVLFRATVQMPNEGLRKGRRLLNGWEDLVRGRLTVFKVPSVHSGVFKEPIHEEVFRGLREVLEG